MQFPDHLTSEQLRTHPGHINEIAATLGTPGSVEIIAATPPRRLSKALDYDRACAASGNSGVRLAKQVENTRLDLAWDGIARRTTAAAMLGVVCGGVLNGWRSYDLLNKDVVGQPASSAAAWIADKCILPGTESCLIPGLPDYARDGSYQTSGWEKTGVQEGVEIITVNIDGGAFSQKSGSGEMGPPEFEAVQALFDKMPKKPVIEQVDIVGYVSDEMLSKPNMGLGSMDPEQNKLCGLRAENVAEYMKSEAMKRGLVLPKPTTACNEAVLSLEQIAQLGSVAEQSGMSDRELMEQFNASPEQLPEGVADTLYSLFPRGSQVIIRLQGLDNKSYPTYGIVYENHEYTTRFSLEGSVSLGAALGGILGGMATLGLAVVTANRRAKKRAEQIVFGGNANY